MKLRKLLFLVLITSLMLNVTACNTNKNKIEETKSKNNLKIYYMDYDITTATALNNFREKYKDVNVEDTCFRDEEEYKTRLITDILSGEGPDVVIIRSKWFDSINKFASSGALYDLNEFIKKDKEFKLSDYNEKVLNSFEQDGKRFMIPLAYNLVVFTTSKEALARNNLKIDFSKWNYNDLLDLVRKYQEKNKDKKKYFFSDDFDISSLMKSSGLSFVDYKNRKSLFNTKDFIEILKIYKEIYPSICPEEVAENIPLDKQLKDDVYILKLDTKISPAPYALSGDYSLYKSIGEEMEVCTLPVLNGNNTSKTSYSDQLIGINSQSKNKDTAYNFIKTLMSKESQITFKNINVLAGLPINKSAYKEDAEFCMSEEFGEGSGTIDSDSGPLEIKSVPFTKRLKTQVDNLISTVNECKIEDNEIFNIVKETIPDFINGKKSAEQTAKEIDNKVDLYLNE
ncbi:MAG: ABC transporter substrate-binding protein [Bacillota bacterium]|nr:ABC transporter substrate-binding protein [Bacillota bacterium]